MILAELTTTQRSLILAMAAERMEAMRTADVNAWTMGEYVELENLAYALTIGAAE